MIDCFISKSGVIIRLDRVSACEFTIYGHMHAHDACYVIVDSQKLQLYGPDCSEFVAAYQKYIESN